jgi:hypothetical protein
MIEKKNKRETAIPFNYEIEKLRVCKILRLFSGYR